jgi:hypothetical protein
MELLAFLAAETLRRSFKMTDTALRLRDELLRLPEEDRIELANVLWSSVEDIAWIDELERRSQNADAEPTSEQSFRETIAELRKERP